MSAELHQDRHVEIGHVLFIDVVAYSKHPLDEQREIQRQLNDVVRNSAQLREAEAKQKLTKLPTGDGMALVFFTGPEAPVRCALEINAALDQHPGLTLRMGIHSGPVSTTTDVNDRANVAGAGINVAQRVMSCGDAGHILLSKHVAEDLSQLGPWDGFLHDLGVVEVKHGENLAIVNLYHGEEGNPELPRKFRDTRQGQRTHRRKRLLAGAAVATALCVGLGVWFFNIRTAEKTSDKSIAVLPFENLSAEQENAFFADGVQDEILTDLAKLAGAKVISRTSVMQFKTGTQRNLRQIAQSLGVSHVVEGSVQRSANRVRVSAQLIDARTDTHLWAEHYDRPLGDVFAIQSEIAQSIAEQLKINLSFKEKAAIAEKPTSNLVAYDRYLKAKLIVKGTTFSGRARENLLEGVALLKDAVALDPDFFLAYYQLAFTNDRLYFLGLDHTPERLALAENAVQNLRRLRPDAGETHLAIGQHLYRGYLDYDGAHKEFEIARHNLPNDPLVYELTGYINRRQGRWEESAHDLEQALELDPRNFFTLQQISLTYLNQRRFADTAATLDRALAVVPGDPETRVARAAVDFHWRADLQPLHQVIESVIQEKPEAAESISETWLLLALCERNAEAISRAENAIPSAGINENGVSFPRSWCQAIGAKVKGDSAAAQTAFGLARGELEKVLHEQPDYAKGLAVLGLTDAALGHKEEAIREGKRAVELLPASKDALNGAYMMRYLSIIYSWVGEKDLAVTELSEAIKIPGDVTYGQLRLHPYWDNLRGDPRFEALAAKLAPEQKSQK